MVAVRKSTISGMTVAEFLDWNGDGTDARHELVIGADGMLRLDSIGSQVPLRTLHAGTHLARQPD